MPTDTAPVRPGEEIDAAILGEYLRDKIEGAEGGIAIEQFPGGHSNLTYLIRTPAREYVLRRGPLGPVPPKAHDMAREYRVLAAVHPHFAPAPEVYALCEDTAVIGAIFFVMQRRRGIVLRNTTPAEYAGVPDLARRISEGFVDCLAQLHAVDVVAHGLTALGKPEGFLERQVKGWADRWYKCQTEPLPAMDRVIGYLVAGLPAPSATTLVHNDFKLDNLMLDAADPSRVEAVLDWEMTTVGDPMADLGLTLCYWQQYFVGQDGRAAINGVPDLPGWFGRDRLLARYEERTGRKLANVEWHEILGIFKLAVIVQQIYYRFHKGQTKDMRFQHFDRRTRGLVEWAAANMERAR